MSAENTLEQLPREPASAIPLWQRALERGLVPEAVIRMGIRHLIRRRLEDEGRGERARRERYERFVRELASSPIAVHTDSANDQHYEVPARFFELVLGSHRKYSAGYWAEGVADIDASERAALDLVVGRARIDNGQDILELGCGWGSLSLHLATRFPDSRIVAVSNSSSQRSYIEARALAGGVTNLTVVTSDMNEFDTALRFDRVVSIEMLEHMRNYGLLFERIASWMKPDGLFFAHIFCHQTLAYPFEARDETDWMARHFFTGGIMPSRDLPGEFNRDLRIRDQWWIDGTHYQKTSEAWLRQMKNKRTAVLEVLGDTYGRGEARRWFVRWKVFFMACAELFGFDHGRQWGVSHYLFERTSR